MERLRKEGRWVRVQDLGGRAPALHRNREVLSLPGDVKRLRRWLL